MKITAKKIIWAVPLVFAAVIAVVGWWTRSEVQKTIQGKLKGELETVLDANVTALEIWMRNQQRMAETIASDPHVRDLSLELLKQFGAGKTDPRTFAESPKAAEFERMADDRLRVAGYLSAQLVTTNHTIAASSGRGRLRLGTPVNENHKAKYDELFNTGKAVIITPFKPGFPSFGGGQRRPFRVGGSGERREPERPGPPGNFGGGAGMPRGPIGPGFGQRRDASYMQVAAPVKDADGHLIGALAFIIRPEDEFTKVLSVARPGDSGETFAFDQSGLMISRSRFDEQLRTLGLLNESTNISSALTLELRDPGGDMTKGYRPAAGDTNRPLTQMIADAVEGGSGVDLEPSRDYRGVPVVGAWRWLSKHGFGVVTKIDAAEAYQPLRVLRFIFISLTLLLALCAVVILLFSYLNWLWRRKFNEAQLKAKQLGQYILEEKIGEGGMGVVYRASHALMRRETAIKLLTPDRADEYSIRQFEHEVQLTCQLTHPNTIQIYDYGHTPEGIFYYAMELLRGLTLAELLLRNGAQPQARAIHMLLQVCESLKEAHGIGLVHRDIKPGNIFLCERGGEPDIVKVLDFGLVKRSDLGGGKTSADEHFEATLIGTPVYLAPETIKTPNQADPRSDIYAIGALGYSVLTGKNVFEKETVAELCESHLSEMPIPPSQRTSNPISPELEAIILRCLEKSPADRPQSVGELHSALMRCPCAMEWTLNERAAWWSKNVHLPVPPTPRARGAEGLGSGTVKIELIDRTSSSTN